MDWETISALIVLVGFLITMIKTISPLTKTMTELNCNVANLNERIKELAQNNEKQDTRLENHEIMEKSRTVQSMNTQNLQLMRPGLWRPDDTWSAVDHRGWQYRFAGGYSRS